LEIDFTQLYTGSNTTHFPSYSLIWTEDTECCMKLISY